MAETQLEIETKFDVAPDFVVGDLTDLLRPGDSVDVTEHQLESVYYDTAEGDLHRSRLTLRRRTGTSDTGWHLKVPGAGFRTELRWPLGHEEDHEQDHWQETEHEDLPDELRRLINVFTHGNRVAPIARLRATRIRHTVRTVTGSQRLEIADDQVWASTLALPVTTPRWHEVEVELGPDGTQDDLERAAAILQAAGAFPSTAPSKLTRALLGSPARVAPEGSAAETILEYLTVQTDAITAGHFAISLKPFDAEATLEPHEAVHQTRVAIRRYRAVLRVFAPLFDTERATRLEAELKWFAAELGEVRDREVLRVRLARAVEDLPAFLVVGPVAEQIDTVLISELRHHADRLLQLMREPRYHAMLDELAQWRTEPPFTAAALEPAEILGPFVDEANRHLRARMRRAGHKGSPEEKLHRARKAGKRARYAAEASAPVLGESARELASSASRLQTLLGEHQDAVVAAALLRRVADQVAEEGRNAFTFGFLVADQRRAAQDSAAAARKAARR